jgi:hypothetical protein
MNDIKLASRGGARLSDILPDYIVKGIYVADNTYHLNNKKGFDHDYTEHKVTDGQVDMSDDKGPVSCTSPACPTSPWLGYIPLPHCPKNYQMSITFAPYRWRMAELYRVTDGNDPNTNPSIADFMGDASTTKNIFSGNAINKDGEDEGPIPRNKYFEKPDDKVLDQSYRTIETASATVGSPSSEHTHSVTEPITLQVNTWLNSTVMERELNPGSDKRIIGWDVLMGFLSRGTEYENIIDKMGYIKGDPDTTYWNIFPVYAQDLAGIATVYCGFNRHPLVSSPSRDNVWGAGLEGSPVIDYEQLDPDRYRDVLNYSRNPVSNANGTPGTNWSKAVNDPTLKYDDAW